MLRVAILHLLILKYINFQNIEVKAKSVFLNDERLDSFYIKSGDTALVDPKAH